MIARPSFAVVVGLLIAGILSDCGRTQYGCAAAIIPPPQLVYPVDGATGVPNGNFTLVVENILGADSNDFLSNAALLAGSTDIALPLGPSPDVIPTPHLTPLPPPSALLGAQVPVLAAHTTYAFTVTLNRLGPCGGVGSAKLGSFTTR